MTILDDVLVTVGKLQAASPFATWADQMLERLMVECPCGKGEAVDAWCSPVTSPRRWRRIR